MNLSEVARGVPKTELTYLRDMSSKHAEADILKLVPDKGSHSYMVLDRSIFHPKGGGQPSDRGTIRSHDFTLDVKKSIFHDGVVVHWTKIMAGEPRLGRVTCELDWAFRYLVMRRHTAAHLLDHCLADATNSRVQTTDSWLDEPCYVGYAGTPPDTETTSRTELLANEMIRKGARVEIRFLTGSEAQELLKSAPNFERLPELDEVRTVTIEGCEPIPCGGTHVTDVKEIKKVRIPHAESMPDSGFRLHFAVD